MNTGLPNKARAANPAMTSLFIYKLLSYTNVGTYQFPATIAWTASAYTPTSSPGVIATGMTTLVSLRMPEQVAGSTFQLDEESALTIWDWEQGKLTKSGPKSEACMGNLKLSEAGKQQVGTNAQAAITNRLTTRP
jgi:hypothetical protein